jgi:hypothetical protein
MPVWFIHTNIPGAGCRNQKDHWGLKPAWANNSQDSISKKKSQKWAVGVAQALRAPA